LSEYTHRNECKVVKAHKKRGVARKSKAVKPSRKSKRVLKSTEISKLLEKYRKKGFRIDVQKFRYGGKERIAYVINPIMPKKYKSKSFRKEMKRYSESRDAKRKALPAGKRIIVNPKTGKVISIYYEYRLNRADAPGKTV